MPEDQQQPADAAAPPSASATVTPTPGQQPSDIIQPIVHSPANQASTTPDSPTQPSTQLHQPQPQVQQQQISVQPAPVVQAPTTADHEVQPTVQPTTQTQQPGVVAPVVAQPVSPPTETKTPQLAETPSKTPKIKKPFLILGGATLAVVVIGLLGVVFVAIMGDSNTISKGDLVADNHSGVAFERPSQWVKNDHTSGSAYLPKGEQVNSADQGMIVASQKVAINYDRLSEGLKKTFSDQYLSDLSDEKALESDGCRNVSGTSASVIEQEGYSIAYLLEATCAVADASSQQGRVKVIVGIVGDQAHITTIVGLQSLWESSGEALDTALRSMSPVL